MQRRKDTSKPQLEGMLVKYIGSNYKNSFRVRRNYILARPLSKIQFGAGPMFNLVFKNVMERFEQCHSVTGKRMLVGDWSRLSGLN